MLGRRRQSPGFTLLELVVVLSLLAAVGGVALLGHAAVRERLALWAAARQVAMHLNLARLQAIRENADRRLVFPPAGGEYQPQRWDSGVFVDAGAPLRLPAGTVIAACTAPEHAIRFRPRGNALQFGTVTLRNQGMQKRRVIVSIAGHVRVER
jgi:prepilin-type N-terminal cleavage/methylation domain-containing protein